MAKSKVDGLPYEVIDDILGKLPAKSMVRFMCVSKALCTNSITLTTLQILIRLPAESLVRFMCLSKSWCNLIRNDPSFKALYTKTNNARQVNPRYLVQQTDNRQKLKNMSRGELKELGLLEELEERPVLQFFSLHDGKDLVEYKSFGTQRIRDPNIRYQKPKIPNSRSEDPGRDVVIGSHNGLFLMGDFHCLFLWNPSINKVRTIPKDDFPSHWEYMTGGTAVGFCKKDEEDFKVISFGAQLVDSSNDSQQVQEWMVSVYSMSTDSWKEIQGIYIPGDPYNNNMVTLDGVPHWIATSWEGKKIIMSFNFDKEEFGHIMFPIPISIEVLGVYKGSLSIFKWCSNVYRDAEGSSRADYEMWVLREYGDEPIWTKLFLFQQIVYGIPISMGYNGEVFMNKAHKGKLCRLYDSGEVREFEIHIDKGCIIPYRESLFLLGV
ncbi:hypothetical protein Tsubulata_000803 [Turnera subulata]|uniref:F-box domain-containing protein n=1 Tax=Turnera subulata TaxID=218843 RepID=A0A9Q0G9A7_9ROSI|nr:hypothetical protein Tsubulata_000803 [Turnera subulata]